MTYDFNIVIPVYNEGKNILDVINHIKNNVKSNYQILICYDSDSDNLFNYNFISGSKYGVLQYCCELLYWYIRIV